MIAALNFTEAQSAKPRKPIRATTMPVQKRSYEYHEPVLLAETMDLLMPAPGRLFVDGTLGGGGHTAALLARGAQVIGLDQDADAIAFASARLGDGDENFRAVRSSFARVGEVLDELGIAQIEGGALLDLGISSHHVDDPARGFSFQADGPLDMRMDQRMPLTAADLVNTMSSDQLERIFRTYGDEPAARKIAARLTRDRMVKPFTSTLQLAEAIESITPRRSKTHPATRVFQALRIAVNRELDALTSGLEEFTARLAPGARFGVISFHSLEAKAVKSFFKSRSIEFLDRPEWPAPRPNPDYIFKAITRKAVSASKAEQLANPRSRSAELRVVEKLPPHVR